MKEKWPALRALSHILTSGLAINVTTFAVLALAPLRLDTAAFAHLSLSVAGIFFGSTLLDLGLSTSTVRQFAKTKDPAYLSLSLYSRALLVVVLWPIGLALLAHSDHQELGTVLLGASSLNFWNGLRAADQARERYIEFGRSNFLFAATRLIAGATALASGHWIAVSLALFVVPIALIVMVKAPSILRLMRHNPASKVEATIGYAKFVYLSALTYNAVVYLPQAVAAARLDAIAVGTLGVALTFVGPVSLVNNALRMFLLPKVSSGNVTPRSSQPSNRRAWLLLSSVVMVSALIALISIGAHILYGHQFPTAGIAVALLVGCYTFSSLIGLLNMRVHTLGKPEVEAYVNLVRLLVAGPVCWLSGSHLITLLLSGGAAILLGEMVLYAAIRFYESGMERPT